MACGDRYKHLLRASGGRTSLSPFESWCNEVDAEAWYAQATHVQKLNREAWNALMKIENAAGSWPRTDKIRTPMEAHESGYDALPLPSAWMAFGMAGCSKSVGEMVSNIGQGACVLEQLNDALDDYGSGIVDPGTSGDERLSSWVPWAVGGAAVVVGVGLYFALGRRPSPTVAVVRVPSSRPAPRRKAAAR